MRTITLLSSAVATAVSLSTLPAFASITRLSSDDRAAVLNQKFDVTVTTSNIPKCVRDAFADATGTKAFEMADPGQAFQSNDYTYNGKLPFYRLVFAGRSDKYYIIEALRGGMAPGSVVFVFTISGPAKKDTTFVIHQVHGPVPHSDSALVFDSTPESAKLVWWASEQLTAGSIDGVRKAIVADKMTDTGFDVEVPATSDPSAPGNISPMATINKAW
jgi:hypothetical protein